MAKIVSAHIELFLAFDHVLHRKLWNLKVSKYLAK